MKNEPDSRECFLEPGIPLPHERKQGFGFFI